MYSVLVNPSQGLGRNKDKPGASSGVPFLAMPQSVTQGVKFCGSEAERGSPAVLCVVSRVPLYVAHGLVGVIVLPESLFKITQPALKSLLTSHVLPACGRWKHSPLLV